MNIRMMIIGMLVSVITASAQDTTTAADSIITHPVKKKNKSAKPVTYIVPAAMFTYGLLALKNPALIHINKEIKQTIWDNNPHSTLQLDDYTIFVPAVAAFSLNLAGVKGKHNLTDQTFLYGISMLVSSAIVFPTKRLTKELRPDGSNRLSMPSGHTSMAFVAAEFLRQEYKHLSPCYGIAGYAVATTTAYLRLYNNKHWLSDVIAGAGVGILSVQAAYWVYPKLKEKFTKKTKRSMMILPYYQQQQAGLLCIYQIK